MIRIGTTTSPQRGEVEYRQRLVYCGPVPVPPVAGRGPRLGNRVQLGTAGGSQLVAPGFEVPVPDGLVEHIAVVDLDGERRQDLAPRRRVVALRVAGIDELAVDRPASRGTLAGRLAG